MSVITHSLISVASRVKLMAFDVDGVMTDGRLHFSPEGETLKSFHALDGFGLKSLMEHGIEVVIITGRRSQALEKRAQNLGIRHLHQGIGNKLECLENLLTQLGHTLQECGYMGDDIMDLPIMNACGFSAAPANAHRFVLKHARYTTEKCGGEGAVRELCDFLLDSKGLLDSWHQKLLTPGNHTN